MPADPHELAALKALGNTLFLLLNDHAHHENHNTLAHLEEKVQGAAAHDLHEHEELEKLQDALEQRLSGLEATATEEDMHLFYLEASHFYARYLLHIHHEETETELLLQQNFTDAELMGHHAEVMRTIDFGMLCLWMQYMVPAMPQAEGVAMLAGAKAMLPPDAFAAVLTGIAPELTPERYLSLTSKLYL